MSKLTLMLFGPPRVELDDEPVEINRRKAQALLAYLAVSRQPHSRDALATLFYPDQDQRRARAYLRRDLAVLNAGLDGTWFDADRETVELAAQGDMWLDVARFRRIDAAVQQHHPSGSGLCADCLTQLREAAGLYTDNFLAGFTLRDCPEFDDWQFFQAESLRQDLAGVLERLVAGHNDLKDYAGAIPYARRWVALDPLHEPPQRILIRLYDQAGQPSAAVRLYEEYAALLEAEMGIPPDEETVTLFEAVKAKRMLGPALKLDKVAAGSRAQPSSPNPTAKKQMPAVAPPTRSAAPMPVPGHQLPTQTVPMIGRDSEYQQLLKTVEGTLRGRGQLILIEGEPGIGKSRLAQEVLDQAYSRGMATLWQKCYQSEQSIPYQALIDLATQILTNWPADTFAQIPPTALAELTLLIPELKTHFPDLPDPPGGLSEARQARLFRALQQFMLAPATNGPLALVMDDIQWADQITLQFMIHLARYLADQPVLLICTYRTEEVATTEHLTEAIHALRSEPHTIHTLLTRLSLQSTDQLVESLAGVPHAEALKQWLHRETDGNPFFMMSILQSLQEQDGLLDVSEADWSAGLKKADTNLTLPDALRRSVQDRLRRVPPAARSLLDVVAVYGRRFDFNTLQMISDERTMTLLETIEELLARQMLREEKEDFYDFNHDKIREVVYHDLSRTRCMLLHRQVAEAIESAAPDQVGTLAEHFELGGAWDKAVIYLNKAAERARRLFAMQEALDFYDRAIDLAERHPRAASKDNLLDLHQQRGETRGLIGGHVAEAVADLLLVLDAARTNNDLIRERNVLLRIGQVHRYGDHYQQALDYTREALHVARQSGDDHGIADALYHVGATVWSQGLNEQALPCHQEAVEITERQNFTDLVEVQAFHGLG
jgi:DNA-binding SARP family transcriptional activator